MFLLLKGGSVFTPEDIGVNDIIVAGKVIANIAPNINSATDYGQVKVINLTGRYVVPGFIDQHVHLLGGGGEAGYASRTPEVVLSDVTWAGATTVVGCLGTDGVTRHMSSLLAKAHGLEAEGISTYIYTGSYAVPTTTITGNVRSDMILIDKVLGCGEIAISDHRSAQPTMEEIARLAAEARVGGMISGKAGVLHLHVGDGRRKLGMLFDILAETEIPVTQFTPTHINRNPDLLNEAIRFAIMGGIIDITAGMSQASSRAIPTSQAIRQCLDQGVGIGQITMSSDGNGSMPAFDAAGRIIGLEVAKLSALYQDFKGLIYEGVLPMTDALKIVTQNPAKSLKLYPQKGVLANGSDADILVLDANLNIEYVIAKGKCMIADGRPVVRGTFERV